MRRSWQLPTGLGAARAARTHVSAALSPHEDADDAVLIASELVANAVQHGRPPVELAVESTPGSVRITVSSAESSSVPQSRATTADDSRGRGLALVEALADDWGWERDGGRILVWAELSARRSPAPPTGSD